MSFLKAASSVDEPHPQRSIRPKQKKIFFILKLLAISAENVER